MVRSLSRCSGRMACRRSWPASTRARSSPCSSTPAPGSVSCRPRTAVRNHLDILDLPGANMTANGTTGSEQILMGLAKDFSLGPWEVEQLPLFVRTHETSVRNGLKRETMEMDLFGMNIIPLVCDYLTFDFPAQRIVLGMGGRFPTPSGKNVWGAPMVLREGRPFVQLRSRGVSWEAGVDTGYFGTLDIKKSTAGSCISWTKCSPRRCSLSAWGLLSRRVGALRRGARAPTRRDRPATKGGACLHRTGKVRVNHRLQIPEAVSRDIRLPAQNDLAGKSL